MKSKAINKVLLLICIFVVSIVTFSCYNKSNKSDIQSSQTILALNKFNNDLLNSKGLTRTISLTPMTGAIIAPPTAYQNPENKDEGKEKFTRIALADLKGAIRGWGWSKYIPTFGISSTIVAKSCSTLIVAAVYSAKAYGDITIEEQESSSAETIDAQQYIGALQDPINLVLTNKKLDATIINNTTSELASDVELPSAYKPLMEIGARHNLLVEKIINNEFEDIAEIYEDTSSEEYQLITSTEFQALYKDEYEYINSPSFSTDGYYCESDDTTMIDDVMNLFIEAFSEYPENINDVNSIVNNYISTIEEFNDLDEEEKQIVYSSLCVAFASAKFWDNNTSINN